MKYYLNENNRNPNYNYEVHKEGCLYMPSYVNKEYLGEFNNCKDAVKKAMERHPYQSIDGCYHCIPECHKE